MIYPYYGEEEQKEIQEVFESGYLNENKKVREFETEFAKFVGSRYCVMTTSGSMALYQALESMKPTIPSTIPTKVPTYMGIFVAHALKQVGINPTILDVASNGLADDVDDVFYVHANGRVAYDTRIKIEDCCQAIQHHSRNAISCYSFASTKHITTGGQGGAVCCDDKEVYENLIAMKDHGRTERAYLKPVTDNFTKWGTNMKVTEFQAAFGLAQLRKLPERLKRFKEIYKIYCDELWQVAGMGFQLSKDPSWQSDIYPETKEPDKLIEYLKKNNVHASRVHKPIHLQPEFNSDKDELVISKEIYDRGIFLPSTTNLTDNAILRVCELIKKYYD